MVLPPKNICRYYIMDIVSIVEAIYLVYMYNFFQTKYSIHHPFEYLIVDNSSILKHPISTGALENKICPLGSYASILGALLLLYRGFGYKTSTKYTKTIIVVWCVVAGLMNMNALVYILPIVYVEITIHKIFK